MSLPLQNTGSRRVVEETEMQLYEDVGNSPDDPLQPKHHLQDCGNFKPLWRLSATCIGKPTLSRSIWGGWTSRPSFAPPVKTRFFHFQNKPETKHFYRIIIPVWGINLNLMSLPLQNTWSRKLNQTKIAKMVEEIKWKKIGRAKLTNQ